MSLVTSVGAFPPVAMSRPTSSRSAVRASTISTSWPTMLRWAGIPIDHVAVNDGFTILSHHRLPNFESDHFGALVEVALRDGGHR